MPLTRRDPLSWTSEERIERAGHSVVAGWDIPAEHKTLLTEVGIPQSDIVEHAVYQQETAPALTTANGDPLYRLTVADQDSDGRFGLSFGVEPRAGTAGIQISVSRSNSRTHSRSWRRSAAASGRRRLVKVPSGAPTGCR